MDITDPQFNREAMESHAPDWIIHLTTESHVDRSIMDPLHLLKRILLSTANLFNCGKNHWKDQRRQIVLSYFYRMKCLAAWAQRGYFTETTSYDPRSPYSASKHLLIILVETISIPTVYPSSFRITVIIWTLSIFLKLIPVVIRIF